MTADNAVEADARWAAAVRRGEVFETRPKPGPQTRLLRARRWARFRAGFGGYFWLPCPLCGQMFGGHEAGELAVHDDPEHPATGTLVCPAHDPEWPDP